MKLRFTLYTYKKNKFLRTKLFIYRSKKLFNYLITGWGKMDTRSDFSFIYINN